MPDTTESDDLLQILQNAASGPESVSTDAGTVKQFSLADVIMAHKYLRSVEVANQTTPSSGLRFAQLLPPGTVQRGYYPRDAGGWWPWRKS